MVLDRYVQYCRQISVPKSVNISSVLVVTFVNSWHRNILYEFNQYFGAMFENLQPFWLCHEILNY